MKVQYGGMDVPNTPRKVDISPDIDTSSVKTFGPGVEKNGLLSFELLLNVFYLVPNNEGVAILLIFLFKEFWQM